MTVIDLLDFVFCPFVELSYFANHDFERHDCAICLLDLFLQIVDLRFDFLFLGESVQFSVNTLDIELAAQVCNLLVPKLHHVQNTLVECLCFSLDHGFQVLSRLFVHWEYLGKDLNVKFVSKQLNHSSCVYLLDELRVDLVDMFHCLVHFLVKVLEDLMRIGWHSFKSLISLLHIGLHSCYKFGELFDSAER